MSPHVGDDDLLESIDRCSDQRFFIRRDSMIMSITCDAEQEKHALIAIRIDRNESCKEKSHRKSPKDVVEKDNRKEKSISPLRRTYLMIQDEEGRCRSNLHDRQSPGEPNARDIDLDWRRTTTTTTVQRYEKGR